MQLKYWLVVLGGLVVLLAAAACGGDDDSAGDARPSQVGAMSETAVDAWIAEGPAGLHGYLAASVAEHCTEAGLEAALADQKTPTAWRNTKDFSFPSSTEATATVIIVRDGKDVDQAWSFAREGNSWKITGMPGLAECSS